jgi:hypothetical protein
VTTEQAFAMGRDIPQDAEAVCPFCGKLIRYRDKIKSHIGQHQKQIALMALSDERGFQAISDNEDSDEEPEDQPVPLSDYPYQTVHEVHEPPVTTKAHDASPEFHTDVPETQSEASEKNSFTPILREAEGAVVQHKLDRKQHSYDRRTSWFLMSDFNVPDDGQFCLGQVFLSPQLDPQDIHAGGLLPQTHIPVMDQSQIQTFSDYNFKLSIENATTKLYIGLRSWKGENNLRMRAQRVNSRSFYPDQAYVQQVFETLQSLGKADILERSQLRRGKIYIVKGIRVAEGLEYIRETGKGVNQSLKVELSIPGVPVEAGVSIGQSKNDSVEAWQQISQPVIIAYSLVEVKSTYLGNLYSAAYTKGSLF